MKRLLLLICAFLLCGCYAHDTTITVSSNGSGTIIVNAGVNKSFESLMQQQGRLPEDSEIAEQIYNSFEIVVQDMPSSWQAQYGRWDDGTYAGATVTIRFTDIAMLQSQLGFLANETRDSGYDEMLVDYTANEQNNQIEIVAEMIGTIVDAQGDPLPDGSQGAGRVSWQVTLPSVTTCDPAQFASCSANTAGWIIPINTLAEGSSISLSTAGLLNGGSSTQPTTQPTTTASTATTGAAATATVRATSQTTSVATTATTAPIIVTPTSQATAQPGVQASATPAQRETVAAGVPTSTLAPTTEPAVPTVQAVQPTPMPLDVTPEGGPVTSSYPPPVISVETPVPTFILPPTNASAYPQPAETLVAIAEEVPADAPPPDDGQTSYLPIIGDTKEGASASAVADTRPVLPGRDFLITLCLLASVGCFGYVIFQRVRRRRAALVNDTYDN